MEHSHTRRPGSGRPRIRGTSRSTHCACSGGRLKSIQGGNQVTYAPAVSPRTIVNRLLAAGLRSGVSLARLPLTPQYRQARLRWCCESVDWRVEWRSVVFSDESRFCVYASMDVHVYGVDLASVIFWSVLAHDTPAPTEDSWCGAISYFSRSHLVFLQGKVNSASYIAQIVNPLLLPFLRRESDVFF